MAIEDVYARCLNHARRVLPPDPALEPADLVQSAWVKVGRRLDAGRSEGEQVAYLCLVIGQIATDQRRQLKRRALGGVVDERHPSPERLEEETIARVLLAAALGAAPEGLLLFAAGWLWDEIAALVGVPTNTLRVQAHRWRAAHERMGA
jgi:DNA-directed RNA polymerase specialized sigma24 family protein